MKTVLLSFVAILGAAVLDSRGKAIPAHAQRIAVAPIPMASVIAALDQGTGRLAGIHNSALVSARAGLLGRIFPSILQVPTGFVANDGFRINAESLLLLRPDVSLQWDQPAEAVESVQRAGIPVVTLTNDPPTQEAHEHNLRIVGQLLGKLARVEELISHQRATLAEVRARVKQEAKGPRPRVLYLRSAEASFVPAGSSTYQDFWIRLAGGDNVARDLKLKASAVSAEQLIKWSPDVILLGSFDGAAPDLILRDSRFAAVPAVRSRRVYKLPHGGYRWDPGSLESHLTWQWAAEILHAGRVRFPLRHSMRETYLRTYGFRLSDADIDGLLQMPLNSKQAYYDSFRRP